MLEGITVRKCLEFAVETEKLGAKYYERMARKFADNPEVVAVFKQLSKDETDHEVQFTALLQLAPPEQEADKQAEKYQFLRAMAISEFFGKDSFKDMEEIKTAEDAMYQAFFFEKSTLMFYQAVRDLVQNEVATALDKLIQAEKTHVVSLMKVLMTQGKFRSLADKWA